MIRRAISVGKTIKELVDASLSSRRHATKTSFLSLPSYLHVSSEAVSARLLLVLWRGRLPEWARLGVGGASHGIGGERPCDGLYGWSWVTAHRPSCLTGEREIKKNNGVKKSQRRGIT